MNKNNIYLHTMVFSAENCLCLSGRWAVNGEPFLLCPCHSPAMPMYKISAYVQTSVPIYVQKYLALPTPYPSPPQQSLSTPQK